MAVRSSAGRRRSTRTGAAVVVAVLALAASACSSSSDSSSPTTTEAPNVEPVHGGALVVGTTSEVNGFNPLSSQWSGPGFEIARAVLDPLAVTDTEGNWQPYLAKDFVPDETFRTWTIELRPGVRFHNGEPFDADALIVYLEAMVASPLTSVSLPETPIIAKTGDLSVQLAFTDPWSSMPVLFADQPGYIIAPEQVRSGDSTRPIGTGPFVYDEWIPDKHFRAVRNDTYWQQGLPYADSIEFRPMPDRATRSNALRTGEINVVEAGTFGQADREDALDDGLRVVGNVDVTGTLIVLMNMDKAPTSDPRVREAVVRAIDRQAFRATLYDETFPLATQPYADDSPWYAENGYPTYDPEAARQLVDEYELENGDLRLRIMAIGAGEALRPVEYLQQVLAAVGIDLQIDGVETVSFVERFVDGDYQAVYVGGFFGAADPDGLRHFLISSNAAEETLIKLNFARHRSDVIDDALAAQRTTDDREERAAEWAKIWKVMAEDLPYAFLVQDQAAYVSSTDVYGFDDAATPEGVPLPTIARWTPFFTTAFIAG